jgi:hypothetical protein
MLTPLPEAITSKSGFGQVKIMKEFVWIDRNCFLKFAFWQVGEKIKAKTATTNIYVKKYFLIPTDIEKPKSFFIYLSVKITSLIIQWQIF